MSGAWSREYGISSKVEQSEWRALQELARESHQSISGLLTEAIRDYARKRRLRPVVMKHRHETGFSTHIFVVL